MEKPDSSETSALSLADTPYHFRRALLRALYGEAPERHPGLSIREQQVAELSSLGASVDEISQKLRVSAATVRVHLAVIRARRDADEADSQQTLLGA